MQSLQYSQQFSAFIQTGLLNVTQSLLNVTASGEEDLKYKQPIINNRKPQKILSTILAQLSNAAWHIKANITIHIVHQNHTKHNSDKVTSEDVTVWFFFKLLTYVKLLIQVNPGV